MATILKVFLLMDGSKKIHMQLYEKLSMLIDSITKSRPLVKHEVDIRKIKLGEPFDAEVESLTETLEIYIDIACKEVMHREKSKFPLHAKKILMHWFFRHYEYPYPSKGTKKQLSNATGVSLEQVERWFYNARVRLWTPFRGLIKERTQ